MTVSALIVNATKADFDQIITELEDFWGDHSTARLHHVSLINQFGNSAFVVKEGERVVAYLFGFLSQVEPSSWVHLVAVRKSHQGRGWGRQLYQRFIEFAREHGAKEVMAQTSLDNLGSVRFHKSIGMELLGEPDERGIPVVKDRSGPGRDRIVFRMSIEGV
ncbi:MAG: N-acetyltransferase family protein [Chloroflexota bacterium]